VKHRKKKRKPPRRHRVKRHVRNGHVVRSYVRGRLPWYQKAIMVHRKRSLIARHTDEALKAPVAKSFEEWRKHPDRYDLLSVDYPKKSKTEKDLNRGSSNKIRRRKTKMEKIDYTKSGMKRLFSSDEIKGVTAETTRFNGKLKRQYTFVLWKENGIVVREKVWRHGQLVEDRDVFYSWSEVRDSAYCRSYKPTTFAILARKVARKRGFKLSDEDEWREKWKDKPEARWI